MAHWAELDESSKVVRVVIGSNDDPDEGYQWIIDNLGGTWLKTSYNTRAGVHILGGTPFRKNYAGVGYTYDPIRDAFIPPKPDSITTMDGITYDWHINEDTCLWVSDLPPNEEITEEESPFA